MFGVHVHIVALKGWTIVDVRIEGDYAKGHCEGAVNLPLFRFVQVRGGSMALSQYPAMQLNPGCVNTFARSPLAIWLMGQAHVMSLCVNVYSTCISCVYVWTLVCAHMFLCCFRVMSCGTTLRRSQ